MNSESKIQEEKVLQAKSGFVILICGIFLTLVGTVGLGYGIYLGDQAGVGVQAVALTILGSLIIIAGVLLLCGLSNQSKRSISFGIVWELLWNLTKRRVLLGKSFCHSD